MRERRNDDRGVAAALVAALGAVAVAIARRAWLNAAQRPVDSLAILGASAASLVIVVNALFLQSGSHPAPFFAIPAPAVTSSLASNTLSTTADPIVTGHSAAIPPRGAQTVAARSNDPIGELIDASIGSPTRVTAVQRALSEFGYGQIKPSGVLDGATSAAIQKFERDHLLPVTGRLSDRLLSELAAMTGRPLR